MSKGRIISRTFFVSTLSFFLIFAPIDFSYFLTSSASGEVFSGEDETTGDPYEEWSGVETVSGYRSINSDVTVTVKPGTIIEFEGRATLEVFGKFFVEGTPSNPVVFRKKNADNPDEAYSVISYGEVRARNIDVSGGGSTSQVFMAENRQERSILNRAQALWIYGGAFGAKNGGSLDIERADFHGNPLAVYADWRSANLVKVWRSRFSGNDLDFVNDGGSVASRLQYDWWGSVDGPAACETDCGDEYYPRPYQKIIGKANFSDWAKEEYTKDPVIVIPGIMGSWKVTNGSGLELDPTLGTYDDFLETLKENGYEEGKNLFPFPYEWRQSNVDTAAELSTKIDAVKALAG